MYWASFAGCKIFTEHSTLIIKYTTKILYCTKTLPPIKYYIYKNLISLKILHPIKFYTLQNSIPYKNSTFYN